MSDGTATANLYRPKLITILGEGYGFDLFRRDAIAALTVAIVALPLSMAIAVASGVGPERGLYTAIIGGALGETQLDVAGVKALATMPSLDELRGKLIGLLQAPASKIAAVLQAPGGQVARVLSAYAEKGEAA